MRRRVTIQDITWFLDQSRNSQLQLTPSYQRRSVWTNKDRRFFLDTIFKGYPCPAIFLHKRMSVDGRAIYDVVDGKQRLETILMFSQNQLSMPSDFDESSIAGKKWQDLGEAERKRFWNYVLPVELLDFETDETSAVNDAFDRLNRNSRKLEPQELRHARFDGWFIKTVEDECQSPLWRTLGIVTNARAKRMKDAQFISELLLVLIENQQAGFDQQHLDEAYAKYDDPDDEGAELDTESFTTRLTDTKSFLSEMNEVNNCVKATAATVGAFYTLWSLVTLHRNLIGAASDLAKHYASFVGLAARIRDQDTTQLNLQDQQSWLEPATNYVRALQGAHTDLTPRAARLQALLQAMHVT